MTATVKENPSLSDFEFQALAEEIGDEWRRRKTARKYLEGLWADIARQKAMCPSPSTVDAETGKLDPGLAWMPFLEMPWQIQALEIGCADAMRLFFPPNGDFFNVNPDIGSGNYAEIIERTAKTEGFLVSDVNTGDVSAIIQAVQLANQKSYNLRGQIARVVSDILSYGTGAARGRAGKIATQNTNFTGIPYANGSTVPMLTSMSIWNTYLDDRFPAAQMQDFITAPATIYEFTVNFTSLVNAAKSGNTDPERPDGGWIRDALKDIEADIDGQVTMVEMEGDFQIQTRDDEWIWLDNACATALIASKGSETVCKLIRFRQSDKDYRRVLTQPYFLDTMHPRGINSSLQDGADLWGGQSRGGRSVKNQNDPDFASHMGVYGVGPLIFGHPLQKAGSEAFSRSIQAGILNVLPPLKADTNDPFFRGDDFIIAPQQRWMCLGDVETVQIGDVNALGGWFAAMKSEYADVTGTNAPRLGQQTKSHQTAYAVDTETQRGTIRVVDFVQDAKADFLNSWLQMEYQMLRQHLPREGVRVWVPKYKGYMTVTKKMLPERVEYEVFGASEPLEARQKKAERIEKIQLLAQVDQIAVQNGQQPMNWGEVRRAIIEDEEIDVAKLTPEISGVDAGTESLAASVAGDPGLQGAVTPVTSLDDIRLASGVAGPARE